MTSLTHWKNVSAKTSKFAPNLIALAVCNAALAGTAWAEEENREIMEEVVISATKRPQSAQDVSISVQAYSGTQLDRMGVEDVRDLGRLAAGVEFTGGSNGVDPFVVIRGVSLQATGPANASANAVHVDEVPYTRSQFLNFPTFDLERAEVLKGPQGTLFGLAATGGTVNLITKKPTEETDGYLDVSYGSFEELDITGAIGGALTERTNGRLAFKVQQSDGYMRSVGTTNVDRSNFPALVTDLGFNFDKHLDSGLITADDLGPDGFIQEAYENYVASIPTIAADDNYGDLDKFAVRGSIQSYLADNVSMYAAVQYYTDDSEILQREIEGVDGGPLGTDGLPVRDRAGNLLPTTPFTIAHNITDPTYDHRHLGWTLRFDVDLDNATLTTLTGFNDLYRVVRDNTDVSSISEQEQTMVTDNQVFSQEIRMVSNDDSDLFWTVGAFFLNDQLAAVVDTPFPFKGGNDFLGTFHTAYTEDVVHWALFANAEYNLSDNVKAIGGIRYNDENRQYNVQAFDGNDFGLAISLMDANRNFPIDESPVVDESSTTYKLGLEWTPFDDVLLYTNISTGQSAGGFDGSAVTSLAEAINPIKGETVDAFEVGFKTDWVDAGIRFNGAFFMMDYEDIRLSAAERLQVGTDSQGNPIFTQGGALVNAGNAEIKGAEFEVKWFANEYFGIDANVNIMDTEIVEFTGNRIATSPSKIEAIEGSRIPDAPELTYRAAIWSELPLSSGYKLFGSIDYIYRDEAFTRTVEEDRRKLIDDYSLVNARIELSPEEGNWTVGIWAKNLTDESYAVALDGGEGANGFRRITRGMPRSAGISLKYNFL
ncbi:TonB-dependent receptor [Porticoccus sp. W117]|uniref:TonB-dependent receptor n=1 Tax=Porticoccus sp. W117 TaxID=3054777 RepID=UPI002592F742|nr:TonB-dependent receptor [Porticoccus sp. W117]MDM3870096.1 TonB-dependent receptor [Porticoccus sp. W117]